MGLHSNVWGSDFNCLIFKGYISSINRFGVAWLTFFIFKVKFALAFFRYIYLRFRHWKEFIVFTVPLKKPDSGKSKLVRIYLLLSPFFNIY